MVFDRGAVGVATDKLVFGSSSTAEAVLEAEVVESQFLSNGRIASVTVVMVERDMNFPTVDILGTDARFVFETGSIVRACSFGAD